MRRVRVWIARWLDRSEMNQMSTKNLVFYVVAWLILPFGLCFLAGWSGQTWLLLLGIVTILATAFFAYMVTGMGIAAHGYKATTLLFGLLPLMFSLSGLIVGYLSGYGSKA